MLQPSIHPRQCTVLPHVAAATICSCLYSWGFPLFKVWILTMCSSLDVFQRNTKRTVQERTLISQWWPRASQRNGPGEVKAPSKWKGTKNTCIQAERRDCCAHTSTEPALPFKQAVNHIGCFLQPSLELIWNLQALGLVCGQWYPGRRSHTQSQRLLILNFLVASFSPTRAWFVESFSLSLYNTFDAGRKKGWEQQACPGS